MLYSPFFPPSVTVFIHHCKGELKSRDSHSMCRERSLLSRPLVDTSHQENSAKHLKGKYRLLHNEQNVLLSTVSGICPQHNVFNHLANVPPVRLPGSAGFVHCV